MKELLDGLLLGDGSLDFRGQGVRYRHTCKHKEYLEWLKNVMMSHGIEFTPKIYEKPNGYGTGVGYQIYSTNHEFLKDNYSRWYNKEGIKVVPYDLKLTSLLLNQWYIGDGGFDSDKGYLRQIQIAAHSFTFQERDFLVGLLTGLGFKASNRKKGLICISKKSIQDFLDYIGPSPVKCYKYKWDNTIFTAKQPKYKRRNTGTVLTGDNRKFCAQKGPTDDPRYVGICRMMESKLNTHI